MQLNRIKAISFDLDDTLWSFQACVERADTVLLEWLHGHAPNTKEVITSTQDIKAYRANTELKRPELSGKFTALRLAAIRSILIDCQENPELAALAYTVFYGARLQAQPYPDVAPALHELSKKYPLIALSNGNGCVKRAGIGKFFKASLNPTKMGCSKPSRPAFQAVANAAGTQINNLLHVGDDWYADVEGAQNAGAQAVHLNRSTPSFDISPSLTRSSATTLPDLTGLCKLLSK